MTEVTDHLRDLSYRLMDSLNNRTLHLIAPTIMASDFGGVHIMDQTPAASVLSRDIVIQEMTKHLEANPNYHTEILDMSVDIDSANSAIVWVRRTVTGLAEGPDRETLSQLVWTLKSGQWLLQGYQGMRGFSLYGEESAYVGGPI